MTNGMSRARRASDAVKRAIDLMVSALVLVLSSPLLAAVAIFIKLDTPGPVFHRSVRVGRTKGPFRMYKFRSMVADGERTGPASTAADDPRITRAGRFVRRFNLDELPQFINVLRGEMSIVGPRPELLSVAQERYTEAEDEIFSVRPGITDWATVWIRDEGAILRGSSDPDADYRRIIWPEKRRLQLEYVRRRSTWVDLKIVLLTLKVHFIDRFRRDREAHPLFAELRARAEAERS